MSHLWLHRRLVVTLWYLHPSAQFAPSILCHFSQAHQFYHGTHLTSKPWDPYESGVMFTVTCSYAIALGGFALAGAFAFAHIQLTAGHILCSLVLLNPLNGMWTLHFYFSIYSSLGSCALVLFIALLTSALLLSFLIPVSFTLLT